MVDRTGQTTGDLRQGGVACRDLKVVFLIADGQTPDVANHRRSEEANDRLAPIELVEEGLIRRAAEDVMRTRARPVVDGQIGGERRRVGHRQYLVGDRIDVEIDALPRPVEEGERVEELVHARIKAGTLARHRVEVEGVGVGQPRVSRQGNLIQNNLNGAVRKRGVGFAGQPERIVEEAFLADLDAAFDRERATNRIHALSEGREHQRVAAIDEAVVDGHDVNGLRNAPGLRSVLGEAQLRRNRDHAARRIDPVFGIRAGHQLDLEAGVDVAALRRCGMADRQDASTDDHIEQGPVADLQVLAEPPRDRRQVVSELGEGAHHDR